ncbi:hypothetical protein [Sporosarcina sp. FA9]|uniref:hypothetical protein n=1 Tax=Sporosarcina sp. FA9 TaxID=3413030 RepID=UPI003F6604A9
MKRHYKTENLPEAIEENKKVMHQLEHIEMNFWTSNVDEAIKRTVDLHLALVKLSRMQSAKRMENAFNALNDGLVASGIRIQMIQPSFRHKKTD